MRLADLQLSSRGRAVVARVTGEIDLSNARPLERALLEGTPNDTISLVLDLSELDYLDSAGIQMIYRIRESLRSRGQILRLVIPSTSPASAALRLAGINRHIDADETVDDALRDSA
ncbi:MAG: STAS domain-containing protein [Solirubrobacteraceae bacterium]